MRFWLLLGAIVCLALASDADAPKVQVRFSNDYAKAVEFYLDGNFECSVRANPEGNNEYCDGESLLGEHTVSTKGEGLDQQSCKFFIARLGGAYVHLTKKGHLYCSSLAVPD